MERQNRDVFMLDALDVSDEIVRAERSTVSFAEHKSISRSAAAERALSSLISIVPGAAPASGIGKTGISPWRSMASS